MEKIFTKDRLAAQNFAKAATECSVDRIIYLGGLIHEEGTEGNNEAYYRTTCAAEKKLVIY
jgi:hypothetical protein